MSGRQPGRRSRIGQNPQEGPADAVLLEGAAGGEAAAESEEMAGKKAGARGVAAHKKRLKKGIEQAKELEHIVGKMLEEALAEDAGERDLGAATAAAARRMLLAKAVEAASGLSQEAVNKMTPAGLAMMIARLERARIADERNRLEFDRGFAAAKLAILGELQDTLAEEPGLGERIAGMVDRAAEAAQMGDALEL